MFDFLLQNMEGKSLIFLKLKIFGSFDKEILELDLGILSAKQDCLNQLKLLFKLILFQFMSCCPHK